MKATELGSHFFAVWSASNIVHAGHNYDAIQLLKVRMNPNNLTTHQ